ncbi:ras GEF [Athelia psychrophila]|uniref:Ras GEF n=1 Tax=Athelia psychrophila TaxID=1759441 RepID=A0A166W7T6_9AGAM|nr:ras GEF [Fibularhizoctonia sp. CBS 109695]
MHDFAPQQQNANCLVFSAGQVIHVLNRDGSGWWDGELDGHRGWFPSNYVHTEGDGFTSLTAEDLPRQHRHGHNQSSSSAVSWESTSPSLQNNRSRGDHRPLVQETLGADVDSYCPPIMLPPLPQGPSSTTQVMEALRHTHDHYLSTIAAFIGHAHSYWRFSHVSTTGKMYELVGEIVQMVCKLLTIVEAVLGIFGLPDEKCANLKSAKDGLYSVTSNLADAVQALAVDLPVDLTEEDEKASLLRSATGALKAGADCVTAVKLCLNRSLGEKAFIITMPAPGDEPAPFTPSKFSRPRLARPLTSAPMSTQYGEEDVTIQARLRSPLISVPGGGSSNGSSGRGSNESSRESQSTDGTSPIEGKPAPTALHITVPRISMERSVSSPTSVTHTEDDRTTWAGSQRHHHGRPVDEKIYQGSLPSLPSLPLDENHERPEDGMNWMFTHEYSSEDAAYNSEGHLVGATLNVLVTRMTPHDSIVDAAFSAVFFLTFRLFASPAEFVDALVTRYNIMPPQGALEHEQQEWQQRKGIPIRMRVTNIVKLWVEMYWRSSADNYVIPMLSSFVKDALSPMFTTQCKKILEGLICREALQDIVNIKGDRIRDPGMNINPPSTAGVSDIPRPTMTKTLLAALRSKSFTSIYITDFDSLELARQLTIMENQLYIDIAPQELLETGQQGVKSPGTIKAVSSLSTSITGWVAESILNEPDIKKRTALVKFFIKVADRCASLSNYSTPRSILAALDSSTISRLAQTWLGLPQKNRIQLEGLRRLADHGRNYHEYRSRLRETAPPGVPFLGLYLTDVTFCREGNPNHRPAPTNPDKKLLNFNKYHKLARIVQDMQRFQVPYNLKAISEVQEYLRGAFENAKHHGDLQDLYRRSLLVEPKQSADAPGPPATDMRQLFSWATRSQQPPTAIIVPS